jgi:hypothetical protein
MPLLPRSGLTPLLALALAAATTTVAGASAHVRIPIVVIFALLHRCGVQGSAVSGLTDRVVEGGLR